MFIKGKETLPYTKSIHWPEIISPREFSGVLIVQQQKSLLSNERQDSRAEIHYHVAFRLPNYNVSINYKVINYN